jgi:multiple sugar transport system substrate-binding protein
MDVTDIATNFANKYGGYYPGLEGYAKRDNKFIALPLAAIGNGILYRESMLQQAGWSKFPEKTDEFLEMCKALKAKSKPAGFALGKAVGDGNNFAHWIVWSHGGKMVDESGKVAINSPETIKALQYARELYQTFIPGTEGWLDINNNRVFLSGDISVTANGVSLYYSAKNDPKMADMAKDIRTTNFPVGPVGKKVELHQTTSAVIFKYTKYPQAAKEFLRFMMEREQFEPWLTGAGGYIAHPLAAYESAPIWTVDPKHTPYRDCVKNMRPTGYAGKLGYASAGAGADFIVVNMVAEAVSGSKTPKEAMERAQKRAERYYKV